MLVKDLIAALEECAPDATVYTWRHGEREDLDGIDDSIDGIIDLNVRPECPPDVAVIKGRMHDLEAAARDFLRTVGNATDRDLDRLTLVFSAALGDPYA